MVAIVGGSGLGIERTSGFVLGSRGQLGSAVLGRSGESVYVNAANGNLVLSNRDEFLVGRGPDSVISRTYNSLGQFTDDNGDNWRMSSHRRIYGLTGTLNANGSTVRRTDWDGSEVVYSWDSSRSAYVSKEMSGAYDTITRANTTSTTPWIWTDGDSQFSETYDEANGGRITTRRDAERDGSNNPVNIITYGYDASGRLNKITTADGNFTDLVWDTTAGKTNNLLFLSTSYTDTVSGTTKYLTRTRYSYDASNRLETVTVDLSPEHEAGATARDAAVSDNLKYTTTYTYDGASKRVASIAQTDGSLLAFAYIEVDGAYRIASITQTADSGAPRVTTFAYNSISRTTSITDPTGIVTTLSYDSANHLIRQSVAPVAGGNEQITTFSYAGNGFAARNLIRESATLNVNTRWAPTTVTVVANDAAQPAPNAAGNTAEKLTFGASGGKITQDIAANVVNGVRYVADIWVYSASATTVKWGILQGTNTPAVYNVAANTWTRLRAEGIFTSGTTQRRVELGGGNGQVIWATQAQVRQESDPDIYIATTTAAVTSTTIFGSTDDIATVKRFDGAANEAADLWLEREDFSYNTRGSVTKRVDGAGNTFEYSYSTANQKLSEAVYLTPDPDGVAGAGVASNPVVSRFIYDDGGNNLVNDDGTVYTGTNANDALEHNLRFTLSAEGRVTEYRYNAAGQMIAKILYSGSRYTSTTYTEKAFSDWVATTDKSQSEWTDYTYDFRGNLATQTDYRRLNSAGAIVEGGIQTIYVYDQFGSLLSAKTNDNNISETYLYDGLGRVVRFTDKAGVGTWTSYIDTQNRTVTTLSSGLTTTSVYNRAGELVSSIEARAGIGGESFPTDIGDFGHSTNRTVAGQIDGGNAYQYSVTGAGVWGIASYGFTAKAGETLTFAVSLKAVVGSATTQTIGLWGNISGEGPLNTGSARIISGPGTITMRAGGYAVISGLSTTEATRIEITRQYTQDEAGGAYVYVDEPGGFRAGQSLVVGTPLLTRSRYDTSASGGSMDPAHLSMAGWVSGGLGISSAGTIGGGLAANQYLVSATGQWSGLSTGFNANASDSYTAQISLKGAGGGTSASFGIYGSVSQWDYGTNAISSARILSGPGTLVQEGGGLWNITGLSANQETRIEITRSFQSAESGAVFLYPNRPNGWIAGQGVIAGATSIVRTPGSATVYQYDNRGLLRARVDPVGAKSFFVYDRLGRLTGEIDADGSLTESRYDAADRLISKTRYVNPVSAANMSALANPLTNIEVSGIRPASSAADRWDWNVYDKAGRLIETIDAAGAAQRMEYDGAGRLTRTTRFKNTVVTSGFQTTPPTSLVLPTADTANDRIVKYLYDKDGLQRGVLDEDNFLTEIRYDASGRKTETIRYTVAAPSASIANDTISGVTLTAATDIRNYWIYDGRGSLSATIDGEGNVTRYTYTAAGDVAQEIRGQQVTASTSYTMATLPAIPAGTIVETTNYSYNALRQLTQKQKLLSNGHTETTVYAYNNIGKLVSETTSESVSAEARTSTNRYDAKGRLIATLNGNGSAALAALGGSPTQAQIDYIYATYGTRFVYDAADRLVQKITPDGIGSTGNRTIYYYDREGRLRFEVNPLGAVVEYRFQTDLQGNVSNALGDNSDVIVYGSTISTTNLSGGLVDSSLVSAVASIANGATDSRTQRIYDNRGFISQQFSPLYDTNPTQSNYENFSYNSFGELSQSLRPTDTATYHWDVQNVSYNRRGLAHVKERLLNGVSSGANYEQRLYDAFGRLSVQYSKIDLTRISTFEYDRANRQTFEYDAYGNYRQWSYDARGNQLTARDRTGNITNFTYDVTDKDGNAIAATNRAGHYRTITTTTAQGVVTRQTKNAFGQTISITDGAGRTTTYEYDKNGNLTKTREAVGTSEERIVATNNYDYADRLIETVDARGVVTRYSYDAVGRVLTEVKDFGGINATTSYAYDAKGQQILVTDARNVVTKIEYDLKGQKTKVIEDFGGTDLATKDITTLFEYRPDGKVSKIIEAFGKPEQRRTDNEYDTMGRLVRQTVDPTGLNLATNYYYDANNNVVAITDARNNTTRFIYDKENRQILSISPRREVVETGYDADGRAIWNRSYANRIGQSAYNGYGYEVTEAILRSNLTSDDNRDQITRTMYDSDGRRAYAIDGEGYATRFKYDGANNIIKTVVYANSATFSNSSTAASNDLIFGNIDSPPGTAAVTTYTYDNANRLVATTDAENNSEFYQLDAVGNRTRLTNKLGGITDYTYDNLGRQRTEWVASPVYNSDAVQIASGFYKNQYEYDSLGNVTRQIEGNTALLSYGLAHEAGAKQTLFAYDKLGRVIQKTDDTYQGSFTPVENYQYDARGNLIYVTHNSGAKTWLYYDTDNRKIASVSAVNATQATYQEWTYDALGNVLTERTYDSLVTLPISIGGVKPNPSNPANYRQTSFGYDNNNRLEARSVAGIRVGSWNEVTSAYVSTSNQTLTIVNEYNGFGDLVREIDANGNIVHHWYDRNGRETAKIDGENYLTVWYRDEDGNVTEERRLSTKITVSFTEQNTREELLVLAGTNGNDRVTTFTYDKNGRRLTETRLGVGSFSVSTGGALSAAANDAQIQYGYNAVGQVASKTEANGDRTDYQYDNHGRLTWERNAAISDQSAISVHRRSWFFYDTLGNVVRSVEQAVDTNGAYAVGYGAGDDRTNRYFYDRGKLSSTIDASGFQRLYQYDLAGRVTTDYYVRQNSAGANTADFEQNITVYDAAGRVTEQYISAKVGAVSTDQGPRTSFTYNSHGDVLAKSLGGVVQEQFSYDTAGRVSKSTAGDGVWKFFGYDKNGNATLVATSAGADLAGYSVSDVLGVVSQENINASYTVYDKRNMGVKTVEEGRRLSLSVLQNLTSTRSYNAFGETISEVDARANVTEFSYNKMGRLIRKIGPTVEITGENGARKWIKPTEDYYYDISGRMIGMRDASDVDENNVNGAYASSGTSGAGAVKNNNAGYLTTRILVAGTGHSANGDDARITKEFRPDSSIWETRYDAFLNARTVVDGLNRSTTQSYDKMGRVVQITRPATAAGQLIESYSYDGLGQRLKAWNNHYGVAQASTTNYDALGRVISQIAAGGDSTTKSYTWNAALPTTGLGTFGGWEEITTFANSKTIISKTDTFGRELEKTDMGGHLFVQGYDKAGRMVSRTASANGASGSQNFAYFNIGQLSGISGDYGTAAYSYDANSNRTSEYVTSNTGAVITNATTSYDALDRMTSWTETGSEKTPAASSNTLYDAVGNIRRTQATHAMLDGNGNVAYTLTDDFWYRFDALNRVVLDKGSFDAGTNTIVRGVEGSEITYNAAGERATRKYVGSSRTVQIWTPWGGGFDINNGDLIPGWHSFPFRPVTLETYGYSDKGELLTVNASEGAPYVYNVTQQAIWDNQPNSVDQFEIRFAEPFGTGGLKGSFQYDLLGRMSLQEDYGGAPGVTGVSISRSVTYNAKNQVVSDDVSTKKKRDGNNMVDSWRSVTTYDYGSGSAYALGSVVSQTAVNTKLASGSGSWSSQPGTLTSTSYLWWDGAIQSSVTYDSDTASGSNPNYTTNYSPNGFGQIASVAVNDGVAKSIDYVLDVSGQIVRRDETRVGNQNQAAPHEVFYRYGGKQMGMVGNNGTFDTGYVESVKDRTTGAPDVTSGNAGLFRNGTNTGASSYADFSQSLEPFNSNQQGSSGGTYSVQTGDTLRSIAGAVYGDSNLWYRIAEANGLSSNSALTEGQSLILPTGVSKSTHNATTLTPYDPAEAMGDTLPTTPKPPKAPKCGTFGVILMIVVAVAVAAVVGPQAIAALSSTVTGTATAGAAATAAGLGSTITFSYSTISAAGVVAAGAITGAAAAVASQAFGVVTGIQKNFSFKQVALAAISGGVSGGIGRIPGLNGGGVANGIARGALSNAATQGISVATGLQNKFSWTGVAVGGVVGGVSSALDARFARTAPDRSIAQYAQQTLTGGAAAIAGAAARSLLDGSDFGDNLVAALPDVIGSTIGNMVAKGVTGGMTATGRLNVLDYLEQGPDVPQVDINGDLVPNALAGLGFGSIEETAIAASMGAKRGIVTMLDNPVTGSSGSLSESAEPRFVYHKNPANGLYFGGEGAIASVPFLLKNMNNPELGSVFEKQYGKPDVLGEMYLADLADQYSEQTENLMRALAFTSLNNNFMQEVSQYVYAKLPSAPVTLDLLVPAMDMSLSLPGTDRNLVAYAQGLSMAFEAPRVAAAIASRNAAEYAWYDGGGLTNYASSVAGQQKWIPFKVVGGSALVASLPFAPGAVKLGSAWIAANSGLGATTAQVVIGGSVGLGYTEASSWILAGKAPTWGQRIAGTLSGGAFGSGLIGVQTGKRIFDGAVSGGLAGAAQSSAGQYLDMRFFGHTEPFSLTDAAISAGIGSVAGGFGGSVSPWYGRTPSIGNSQSFKAGARYGVRMQVNAAPETAVSTITQVHGDYILEAWKRTEK